MKGWIFEGHSLLQTNCFPDGRIDGLYHVHDLRRVIGRIAICIEIGATSGGDVCHDGR